MDNSKGMVGPSIVPIYTKDAHGCFDMHVLISFYFIFWFLNKQKEYYPELDCGFEERNLFSAFKVAIENDLIRKKT